MRLKPPVLEGNFSTQFVNKHGIAYSCDRYPKRLLSDQRNIDPKDYREIENGDVVYVITSALPQWFQQIYPTLVQKKIQIILVSGDSIQSAPLGIFSDGLKSFNNLISQNVIQHWFCQNCDFPEHNKVTPIPLGIDYHTRHRGQAPGESAKAFIDQDNELVEIGGDNLCRSVWKEKRNKIFSDCHLSMWTNPSDREDASLISQQEKLFDLLRERVSRSEYWKQMSKYRFVLSPLGAGLDCHRTYEALAVGSVPIVKKTSVSVLFQDLPVIVIDDYKDINEEMLQNFEYPEMLRRPELKLLELSFWVSVIAQAQNRLRQRVES